MVKKTGKSSLADRLRNQAPGAVEKFRDKPPEFGSAGDLPDGIEGGIAQVKKCGFGVYKTGANQGEYFYRAEAIVISPEVHNGIRIKGLRTVVQEPVCNTPKSKRATVADHIGFVLNEFKKIDPDLVPEDADEDCFEEVAKEIEEAQPFIRFRTWKGQKQTTGPYAGVEPRVQHEWRGGCEAPDELAGEADGVQEGEAEPAAAPAGDGDWDMDDLAEKADGGDEESQNLLEAKAAEVGISAKKIDNAENYAELVTLINDAEPAEEPEDDSEDDDDESEGDEPEDEPEDEPADPEKGDVYFFKPKGAKRRIEGEVTAVLTKKKTVTLKSIDDGKVFKDVAWSALATE